MQEKILRVTVAPGPETPKTIKAALAGGKETGVLAVPGDVMCLTINSGLKIEVDDGRK